MAASDDDLIDRARAYAQRVHAGDTRKGTGESYFDGHLEPVADLVRRAGGDDIQIAAAYLHDTAEDHGGTRRLADVAAEFGDEVAQIVHDLSDSLVDTEAGEVKEPWRPRKERYLAHLDELTERSLEVSVADKLHNASSILADHERVGDDLWERFTTGQGADQAWYYRALADAFDERIPDHPLTAELRAVVNRFPT